MLSHRLLSAAALSPHMLDFVSSRALIRRLARRAVVSRNTMKQTIFFGDPMLYRDDFIDSLHFKQGSVMTYKKTVRLMGDTWLRVVGEPLILNTTQPLAQFQEALQRYSDMLSSKTTASGKLKPALTQDAKEDPAIDDLLSDTLEVPANEWKKVVDRDLDAVPPRVCTAAIRATAKEKVENDEITIVPLNEFLRLVMTKIAAEMDWQTPLRVGDNRHFPRSWQWLWEVCEESYVDDDYGMRIINTRGPVPTWPSGPGELRVRLDPSRLW